MQGAAPTLVRVRGGEQSTHSTNATVGVGRELPGRGERRVAGFDGDRHLATRPRRPGGLGNELIR